jgi:hypothetical protein
MACDAVAIAQENLIYQESYNGDHDLALDDFVKDFGGVTISTFTDFQNTPTGIKASRTS